MKKQISKLAIIVPYRNRKKQLDRFIKHIDKFFKNPIRSTEKLVDYHIFVVEQSDDQSFNQGKLLNIGLATVVCHTSRSRMLSRSVYSRVQARGGITARF